MADVYGLVAVTDFVDEGRMTPDRFPPIVAEVEAVVLGVAWRNGGHDVRPSRLRDAG